MRSVQTAASAQKSVLPRLFCKSKLHKGAVRSSVDGWAVSFLISQEIMSYETKTIKDFFKGVYKENGKRGRIQ